MSSTKSFWDDLRDPEFAYSFFDEFLNTKIATQIKVIREQRGLRQKELAELAGMKQERISVLENVNYSSWSINTLRRIAQALGVRLTVSFETFGSGIAEARSFDRKSLERASLRDEIDAAGRFVRQTSGAAPQRCASSLWSAYAEGGTGNKPNPRRAQESLASNALGNQAQPSLNPTRNTYALAEAGP